MRADKESNNKKILFSVGKEDCEWTTFTSGGAGGADNTKTAYRLGSAASTGQLVQSRDTRSRRTNKRAAFKRMAASKEFCAWHTVGIACKLGKAADDAADIERAVDAAMDESNLKVEFF